MYMQNHRCKVTGSTSTKKLGKPKPPVYCRDNPTKCVPGPKQMMAWNRKFIFVDLWLSVTNIVQRLKATMSTPLMARLRLTTSEWGSWMALRTISLSRNSWKQSIVRVVIKSFRKDWHSILLSIWSDPRN